MVKVTTSQPRKQRLLRLTAPHHQARKQMASHLSEELLLKYNRRSVTVIVGDEVQVLRGDADFKGKTHRVVDVDTKKRKLIIDGVTIKKADGTAVQLPVDPSNVKVVKLNLDDKRRVAKLEESSKTGQARFAEKRAKKTPAKKGRKAEPKSESKAEKEA